MTRQEESKHEFTLDDSVLHILSLQKDARNCLIVVLDKSSAIVSLCAPPLTPLPTELYTALCL
jgi:hypothetical protein